MKASLGLRRVLGKKNRKAASTSPSSASDKSTPETPSETPKMAEEKAKDPPPVDNDDDDDDEDLFGGDDDDEEPPKPTEQSPAVAATPETPAPAPAVAEPPAPAPAPAPAVTAPAPAIADVTSHVPRKSSSNSSSDSLGAKYGLPPGVKIPASVIERNLLTSAHQRILDALKKIPVELMNESLTEYDDAVQIKGASIRNHGAYLFGVIKRYVDVQETRGESLMQSITPSVQRKLDELVRTGYCTHEEMNEKVKGKIRMLSEKDALIALDELASSPRSGIRNFGSYLMGIIVKRHRSSDKPGGSDTSRLDSRPGRDSDDRYYRESRGGDSYRRDKRSRERERSRDRFDDRGRNDHYGRGGRDRDRDLSAYGPSSHQNQGYSNQPPPMGGGQPPPQHAPPMNSYSQQQNQPPYMQQPPNAYPPNNQQQQYAPPHQQMGSMPPPMNQQNRNYPPPQNQGYQNQSYQQNRPGMPPHQNGPPGMPPQQNMMQPPMGHGQGQGQMQQPYNQQQQQQQTPYMMNQPNQMMNQHQHQHQQQPPYMQQQNQMGGAPLPSPPNQRGPNSYGNSQQGGWQQQQQGPGSYGPPPGGNSWQQPQPGQAPLDIMGLADKAASAVQQLTGQNKGQMPPGPNQSYSAPPPPHSHYSSGPPGMHQVPPGSHMPYSNGPNSSMPYNPMNANQGNHHNNRSHMPQGGGPPPNRRKGRATTTAALHELPQMVQYAVQNLQNTRQVDHALDGGILGMIYDLPEPLALAALQKFASCDKKTMRNKTAYLAGVLRRELERVGRR